VTQERRAIPATKECRVTMQLVAKASRARQDRQDHEVPKAHLVQMGCRQTQLDVQAHLDHKGHPENQESVAAPVQRVHAVLKVAQVTQPATVRPTVVCSV